MLWKVLMLNLIYLGFLNALSGGSNKADFESARILCKMNINIYKYLI